tara:strand:- start:19611 stop:21308 length:1698 start_codon:yes stop_codon:yes gene_type:complete
MISKAKLFFKLSSSLLNVLNKNEKKKFSVYIILSVFNTILEIITISIIILLLLMISGQDISDSSFSLLFNFLSIESIFGISILMILIVSLKTAFQIIFNFNQEKISYEITKRINIELFKKFINSKYTDYVNESSPKILRLLNQESIRLGNQLISPFITMINEIFLLLLIISFILIYDVFLGLGFLILSLILLIAFNYSVNKIVKKLGRQLTDSNTSRIKLINDSFKGFDIIKLFQKGNTFIEMFKIMTKSLTDAAFKNLFYLKLPKSIFELMIFIVVFIMIITLEYTNNQDLLISYLSVSAVSIYKIIPSLNKLSNSFQTIQYFSTPFNEIVEYFDTLEEEDDKTTINEFKLISYENISFSYDKNKILDSIEFKINKNDFIGIHGPSGAGKSTLIKIISGLINQDSGQVYIDNEKTLPIELRKYFSYVPQDSMILDEDIFVNISLEYKRDLIDNKKIKEILKKVDLYETFENNFDLLLGENGIKVSGGQKQRIAIARAIYHDKKILILDESTSSLDPKTEKTIINLLKRISKEISVIIISHKKSSLINCNKIYEINNKKIKEEII